MIKLIMRKNNGFTLIELIVVIAILGILAAILVPSITNYITDANASVALKNGSEVLSSSNRISTHIDANELSISNEDEFVLAIKNDSGINVNAGDSAPSDDGIVVQVSNHRVIAIWSKKGSELAEWTIDGGWTSSSSDSGGDEPEPEPEPTEGLQISNGVVTGYTGSDPNVVIPSTYDGQPVTEIGNSAFFMCDIESVSIPNSVTTIGTSAFFMCDIESVSIPNSVTTIGTSAFTFCTRLNRVTIPNSVTYIGKYAFKNCSNLSRVTMESETPPPRMNREVFASTYKYLKIYVPREGLWLYERKMYWEDLDLRAYD